jgi:L-asparaginase/Glu-tRNA(Gln) amidotransferase subunit D
MSFIFNQQNVGMREKKSNSKEQWIKNIKSEYGSKKFAITSKSQKKVNVLYFYVKKTVSRIVKNCLKTSACYL